MPADLSSRVAPKIAKVIRRFPTTVKVVTIKLNKYKEPEALIVKIPELTGFYHENTFKMRIALEDKGVEYLKDNAMYLMVLIDDETKSIEQGDLFLLDDEYFEVVDKHNPNRLNIYYDVEIRKVADPCLV